MELQKNQSKLSTSKNEIENYFVEIKKEMLDAESEFRGQVKKIFSRADLWNIQRQRRFTNMRRYL
ncbi:MAG: hypothetical protein ABIP35_14115 [Ginsengibacter sp.]